MVTTGIRANGTLLSTSTTLTERQVIRKSVPGFEPDARTRLNDIIEISCPE